MAVACPRSDWHVLASNQCNAIGTRASLPFPPPSPSWSKVCRIESRVYANPFSRLQSFQSQLSSVLPRHRCVGHQWISRVGTRPAALSTHHPREPNRITNPPVLDPHGSNCYHASPCASTTLPPFNHDDTKPVCTVRPLQQEPCRVGAVPSVQRV